MTQGRLLIIAGSDCSGGAGLEADQKTAAAHGVYAMTATTALTAQDTTGVYDIHHTPPAFVAKQIDLCINDIGVDVVKTGMLTSTETVKVVADRLRKHKVKHVVLDPVMISTSGHNLLGDEAISTLCTELLPLATVITPNMPEACVILERAGKPTVSITSAADMVTLAKALQTLGPQWVLIKGGHLSLNNDLSVAKKDNERKFVVDVLFGPNGESLTVKSPFQDSTSTHGTGCTLASAIASNIANGKSVEDSVRSACNYIEVGIRTAPGYGKGHGPLNHFHSMHILPFAPGHFVEWLLARPDVKAIWDEFVYHPFVMGLGNGKLPMESFKGYIIQDYMYLIHYTRAYAMSAYKGRTAAQVRDGAQVAAGVAEEMNMHKAYCQTFGITEDEVMSTPELPACTAYTRYILDVGAAEDWLALQVAQAPCLLGYGAVGVMLNAHLDTVRDGNPYWPWIENYVSQSFVTAVRLGETILEKHMVKQTPTRIEELVKIFIHATRMEIQFWEMFPAN